MTTLLHVLFNGHVQNAVPSPFHSDNTNKRT